MESPESQDSPSPKKSPSLVTDIELQDVSISSPFPNEGISLEINLEEPFDDCPCAKRPRHQENEDATSPIIISPLLSPVRGSSENTNTHSEFDLSSNDESSNDFIEDIFGEELFEPFHDYDNVEDTSEKLYPSSDLTVLRALALLFAWYSSFSGVSKEAFGRLLYIIKLLLPDQNKLPSSYHKAFSVIKKMLIPVEDYDCCVNDCVIFRDGSQGKYAACTSCPVCGECRFKPGTKKSRKNFKYIPLAPRIQRMFANKESSRLIQNHTESNLNHEKESAISDIHQTTMWKENYSNEGFFKGDPRGLSFSLCTDGVNPFAKERVSYSMWPITLTLLNLPRQVRNTAGSMFLVGIIPGKKEANNLDSYLELLVNEFKELNQMELYDAYRDEKFLLRAKVPLIVLDYPGQNKVFKCQGAGAYAGCVFCQHLGEYSKVLSKMVYPGNRKYLVSEHKLRKATQTFPSKSVEKGCCPKLKTKPYIEAEIFKYEQAKSSAEKRSLAQQSGCKGSYVLQQLPFHDRTLDAPVDPMHLIKNVIEHIVKLVTGFEDSRKVREQEKQLCRFRSAWISEKVSGLPKAPFTLSTEERGIANQRLKSVHVPTGFDWNVESFFSKPSVMKSHQWKQVAVHGVLKYCLRDFLGKNQQLTLFQLLDVLSILFSEEVTHETLQIIEPSLHEVLALIERDFPLSLQVITLHLLHHLPSFVSRFGPVYSFWMYSFERFNSWICKRVLNKSCPEANIISTYRLSEWSHFLELSMQLPPEANITPAGSFLASFSACDSFVLAGEYALSTEQLVSLACYYSSVNQVTYSFADISPIANKLKYCYRKISNGRLIRFNSLEMDDDNSYIRNSYVSGKVDDDQCVGRILLLFEHQQNTFAYMLWFDKMIFDTTAKLYYTYCETKAESVVLVSQISIPYIIAFDEEEPNKLWVLNFQLV